MERDGVLLSFQHGKRQVMNDYKDDVKPDEALKALESVVKMESAGWKQAVPDRWFGAGIATIVASMFALYALEDPYPYIVFPIIGLALFIAMARQKRGAYGQDFPSNGNKLALALFTVVLLIVFFGSIFIRRTFDAAWVPLLAGLLVWLMVFFASEQERRAYISKAAGQSPE
jgi:hypothetical protein